MATTPRSLPIPLAVKLGYTAFMAVLVPIYWRHYGPTNFLYFCDVALFLTLAAVWLESPLLASVPAVGILVSQTLWCVDFMVTLCGGTFLGMTGYMFHEHKPLYLRALSSFHGWLPFLLIYLVWRLGYDRRAFWTWTIMAWVLMLVAYLYLPAPPAPEDNKNLPVNVNYVYSPNDDKPQEMMPHWLYLAILFVGWPVLVYYPTHWVLKRFFPPASSDTPAPAPG
jgi:hypothetical protein